MNLFDFTLLKKGPKNDFFYASEDSEDFTEFIMNDAVMGPSIYSIEQFLYDQLA